LNGLTVADLLRFTILGCGSSPGTPRITGDWGACDPSEPKNRRSRCSALAERIRPDGKATRVVIDTGPDFREQMLRAEVSSLDGVLYTHPHADHIHGIDDLRGFVLEQGRLMDVYCDQPTLTRLMDGFSYCFSTPLGSSYPPILKANIFEHDQLVTIKGEGGPLTFEPLPQIHGDIVSLGFRIGSLAYCPDVSDFPERTARRLAGLDVLFIDTLQYRPHPSHFSFSESLRWIETLKPRRAYLTHMHVPLDYNTVMRETPDHVEPAYDGLQVQLPLE
jgi:phosphoribosyl 1,2-cyclic phosphate phosphodiesterase